MRIISLLFYIVLIPLLVYSAEVRVGIVGYTLLEEFRITFDSDTVIEIDNEHYLTNDLIISNKGEVSFYNFQKRFSRINIVNKELKYFISDKGIQPYKGNFIITFDGSQLAIINIIDQFSYFLSVLGSEMNPSFHTEALKAQLMAIKKFYSIRKERNRFKAWDILNTSRVMAYRGQEYEFEKNKPIIKELENLALVLEEGIEPMFFSTAAGYILRQSCLLSTIDSQPDKPVLLFDDNKQSPFYGFELFLTYEQLYEIFQINLEDIELYFFKKTPLVDHVILKSLSGNKRFIKSYEFVSRIQRFYGSNFRSIQFTVEKQDKGFIFKGNGYGHFIGMSQFGAQEMAVKGKTFKEILSYYYPGSKIIEF